jgi:23S rRNA (guanine745-N1)-methyltransferase
MALLQMTPFAWQANENVQKTINDLESLEIETDFILTLFVKAMT